MREQLQTERPSETGLKPYEDSHYAIFICSSSQGAWHMNSANFWKQRINLHALELALRSKLGGIMGVSSVYLE